MLYCSWYPGVFVVILPAFSRGSFRPWQSSSTMAASNPGSLRWPWHPSVSPRLCQPWQLLSMAAFSGHGSLLWPRQLLTRATSARYCSLYKYLKDMNNRNPGSGCKRKSNWIVRRRVTNSSRTEFVAGRFMTRASELSRHSVSPFFLVLSNKGLKRRIVSR